MSGVSKVVRDGMVAVLVSPGYGAGWATWSDIREEAAFAPEVVAWVEAGKPEDAALMKSLEERYGYLGGLRDVEVRWLPVGTRFMIDEYDGAEGLTVIGPDYGWLA